jgi:hypothetical protein
MNSAPLLAGVGVALVAAGCGDSNSSEKHYTAAKSLSCFSKIGATSPLAPGGKAVRIAIDRTKTIDVIFLANMEKAQEYANSLSGQPNGFLEGKENAVVFGHGVDPNVPTVTEEEMARVEDCLA